MEILETNHENQSSGTKKENKNILYIIIIGMILLVSLVVIVTLLGPSSYINYKNYEKIKIGMTYEEVVEILDGHEGTLESSWGYSGTTYKAYSWSGSDGYPMIYVDFENNRVTLKTQVGL